jgi:hypothetical protein
MRVVGCRPYPTEDYRRVHSRCDVLIYHRSLDLITDVQLILGLGIQPQLPSNRADLEASEAGEAREAHARELQQNPKINEASSPMDTEATHVDSDSGRNISLGLDIYNDNNLSEYGQSP